VRRELEDVFFISWYKGLKRKLAEEDGRPHAEAASAMAA